MSDNSMSPTEFQARFEHLHQQMLEQIRADEAQRRASLPARALLWMALAPSWTSGQAVVCGFPSENIPIIDLLERIREAGQCVAANDPDGEPIYWMPEQIRTSVLEQALRGTPYANPTTDQATLCAELHQIGSALQKVERLAPLTRRWATLAAFANRSPGSDQCLERQITLLLDSHSPQPGEAMRWIEAARRLEPLLGGALRVAIEGAGRRLDLLDRRASDQRHLERFLRREDQVQAFEQLLHTDDSHWALHYLGAGGVGKTMLLRYIASELAPRHKLAVTRVDFDYLNPDYPFSAPGLLLNQFARELRLYDTHSRLDRRFSRFDDNLRRLHEQRTDTSAAVLDLVSLSTDRLLNDLIESFAYAIAPLKRVVLMLDTCEELAKFRPHHGPSHTIRATFAILERLHDCLPSLRVVLCGRRPLAASGAGWRSPRPNHPNRPYLLLHEIRGFSHSEAEAYLRERKQLPQHLAGPIMRLSREQRHAEQIIWNDAPATPAQTEHYNPFDLALYADWVEDEHTLSAEQLGAGGPEQYIYNRIIRRLNNPLLNQLIPPLALLNRCDTDTLRAVASASIEPGCLNEAIQALTDQDWIIQQDDMLAIEPALRVRLLAYYHTREPEALMRVLAPAAEHLRQLTLTQPLDQIESDHIASALRLLVARSPAEAADWWGQLELRLIAGQRPAFERTLELLGHLLADEVQADVYPPWLSESLPARSPLRAAVAATYAAALLHTGQRADLDKLWAAVERDAPRHPTTEGRRHLHYRAQAGQIAAICFAGRLPSQEQIQGFWATVRQFHPNDINEQLAASCVAAAEALIERCEQQPSPQHLPALPVLQHLLYLVSPELLAFGAALIGRCERLCGHLSRTSDPEADASGAGFWMEQAVLTSLTIAPGEQRWLDWLAPDNLAARIRLEYVRVCWPAECSPQEALRLIGTPEIRATDIDSDRLSAALLALHLADGFPSQLSSTWRERALAALPAPPACNAHRSYPPLFCALAEHMAACGAVEQALSLLQHYVHSTGEHDVSVQTVLETERALLRIARTMRLHEEGYGNTPSLARSPAWHDHALIWANNCLTEPTLNTLEPLDTADPALLHACWRTTPVVHINTAAQLMPLRRRFAALLSTRTTGMQLDFASLSLRLDLVEFVVLERRLFYQRNERPIGTEAFFDEQQWWRDNPGQPVEAITLILRKAAVRTVGRTPQIQPELRRLLGIRQLALIALDEGELLAMRLPQQALKLLEQAEHWFTQAHDPFGALRASICRGLALARLGFDEELAQWVDHNLPSCYQAAVEALPAQQGPQLPPLQQLRRIDAPDSIPASPWRPWLLRIHACLFRQSDGDNAGGPGLDRWMRTHYQGAGIPGELIWLAPDDARVTQEHGATPKHYLGSDAQALRHTRLRLLLRVFAQEQTPLVPMSEDETLVRVSMQLDNLAEQSTLLTVKGHSLIGDARELGRIFEQLLHLARSWLDETEIPFPITLDIDPGVAGIAWEALMLLALGGGHIYTTRMQLVRTLAGRRSTRSFREPLPETLDLLCVVSDAAEAGYVEQGWRALRAGMDVRFQLARPDVLQILGSEREMPTVLHLVGTPVATSTGIRLRLSEGRLLLGGAGSRPHTRSVVVSADALSQTISSVALCLVQMPSAEPPPARDLEDHEQTLYLRMFASELFAEGFSAVLAVPPLPHPLLKSVIQCVAQALLHRDEAIGEALIAAVAEARATIVKRAPFNEVVREMALELCLYTRPQP